MLFRFQNRLLKAACAGAALALGLACASTAGATEIVVGSGQMTDPLIVSLSGPGYNGQVYDAPMQFSATYGGKSVQILAFCVDVFHDINLGSYSPNLTYVDTKPFTTDSNPTSPTTLKSNQILQVEQLVNYGTDVFNDAAFSGDKSLTLAAIQGAIWQVVSGDTVSSGAAGFDTLLGEFSGASYATYFDAKYGSIGDSVRFMTPEGVYPVGGAQSFLFAAPVPEPASWLMMIVGFGGVGAMLRRRREGGVAAFG